MKNAWKWILGIVIVLAVLTLLPYLWRVLFPAYGYGMMGGYYGYPMMGGYGMMGFTPFGMLFMWLIPLGSLALLVLGIVWLVNAVSGSKAAARLCAHCGRPAQADWKTCPYCGNAL